MSDTRGEGSTPFDDSKSNPIALAAFDDSAMPAEPLKSAFILILVPVFPILSEPVDTTFALQPCFGIIDQSGADFLVLGGVGGIEDFGSFPKFARALVDE